MTSTTFKKSLSKYFAGGISKLFGISMRDEIITTPFAIVQVPVPVVLERHTIVENHTIAVAEHSPPKERRATKYQQCQPQRVNGASRMRMSSTGAPSAKPRATAAETVR